MKMTVEIADSLLEEARKVAARDGTSLRILIEEGLRRVVAQRKRGRTFRLRKATFKGNGLQPGVAAATWDRIREMADEGRGG
jgi:hypothetical protein